MPFVLAVGLGVGLSAAPVPASPGRWQADSARAYAAEATWTLDYVTARPRVGDRLSTSLYLALAEGEGPWAVTYLDRQQAAIRRAEGRSAKGQPSADAVNAVLTYYRRLAVSAQAAGAMASFTDLVEDRTGPAGRAHALQLLRAAAQP